VPRREGTFSLSIHAPKTPTLVATGGTAATKTMKPTPFSPPRASPPTPPCPGAVAGKVTGAPTWVFCRCTGR